jgi:hypothetical protein
MKMTTCDVFVDVATLARPACESQRGDTIGTGSILYRRKTAPAARQAGASGAGMRAAHIGIVRGRILSAFLRYVPWNGHAITRWLTVTPRSAAEMPRGELTDGDFP